MTSNVSRSDVEIRELNERPARANKQNLAMKLLMDPGSVCKMNMQMKLSSVRPVYTRTEMCISRKTLVGCDSNCFCRFSMYFGVAQNFRNNVYVVQI